MRKSKGLQEARDITWTKVDTKGEGDGGKESRSELKTPCNLANTLKCEIGGETQEDTERRLKWREIRHGTLKKIFVNLLLTHICQDMTRPPRIFAGTFSAAKTGDVEALGPIPRPSRRRQTFNTISQQRKDRR